MVVCMMKMGWKLGPSWNLFFCNAEDFDASLRRTVSVSNHIFNVLLVVWKRGIASLCLWYFMMDFSSIINSMPSWNTILHISVFLCWHRVRCQILIFFLFSNILQISELNLVGTLVGHSNTSWLSFMRNKWDGILSNHTGSSLTGHSFDWEW